MDQFVDFTPVLLTFVSKLGSGLKPEPDKNLFAEPHTNVAALQHCLKVQRGVSVKKFHMNVCRGFVIVTVPLVKGTLSRKKCVKKAY
jgi:hypothetical protein